MPTAVRSDLTRSSYATDDEDAPEPVTEGKRGPNEVEHAPPSDLLGARGGRVRNEMRIAGEYRSVTSDDPPPPVTDEGNRSP